MKVQIKWPNETEYLVDTNENHNDVWKFGVPAYLVTLSCIEESLAPFLIFHGCT